MTTVTLNLPEPTMKQAYQAAASLRRPVEELLTEMLTAILPSAHDAPAAMQAELTGMTWLNDKALWEVANSCMSSEDEDRLRQLSVIQEKRPLSKNKQKELDNLRHQYGRITLLKARAYALLSLRGGKPLLKQQ